MQNRAGTRDKAGEGLPQRVDAAFFLLIFAFAFTLRLIYLFRIKSFPLFYYLVGDARSYDEWARQIAAGDWLGKGVFYQAPLYPYFLGLLQVIFGHDLWSIRLIQITLGALSCSFLYLAGRLFLSREAGIAAGFMLSLYAPAIFFDALIQKTVLDLLLITLLLFLLAATESKPHWSRWGAAGVVMGLLGLTRENALVWLFALPIWIWLHFAAYKARVRLRWVGIFLLGLVLVLFPVGLRNLEVGGEFTLTTSQLGPNFFIGNNPLADGSYIPLRSGHSSPQYERRDATELAEQALGRSLTPGEVSAYWLRRSWDYISSQPSQWLRLIGRKWMMTWNVRELEDTEDFYLYQNWSALLRVLGWANHFGVLAPLAALGFVLTWGQRRKLWLLYLLLGTLAFSVTLFYVFGRYRFSMVPLLTLFAGAGLTGLFALLRERRMRQLLTCAAVLLLAAAAVHWPMGEAGPSAAALNNLGIALARQGRIAEAIRSYELAIRARPTSAVAHNNLAATLARQGKLDEAIRHYQEAVRIDPDYANAHNDLGVALARRGDIDKAAVHFRLALRIQPQFAEAHQNLSRALAQQGKQAESIQHYQEAQRILKTRGDAGAAR